MFGMLMFLFQALKLGIKFFQISKLFLFIFIILSSINPTVIFAQCDSITPSFTVDLSSSASAVWNSTSVIRQGYCCGASGSDKCIKFEVTLSPGSAGILFEIATGAVPGGAMFYQVGCSAPTTVGTPLCLSGVGPHIITFCKPGNNINEYRISSFAEPTGSGDIIVNEGCVGELASQGFDQSTITWNSIYPGALGDYNSYLSCTAACDSVDVQASAGYPPYVDFVVCGLPFGGCDSNYTCDTMRTFFSSTLGVQILPTVPTLCIGDTSLTLTANGFGGTPPYYYSWSTGSLLDSIYADTGLYVVEISDMSGCPGTSDTITVTAFASAISADAGTDQVICDQSTLLTLSGVVTSASGGTWSGGSGSYIPNNDSLNIVYSPTPSEISSGQIELILTTTGNGSCPADIDTTLIQFTTFDAIPTLSITNVSCKGLGNGKASIAISGGKPPFTYLWSTSPSSTNDSVSMLQPGAYSVTITDSLFCDSVITFSISQPDTFSVQSIIEDVTCNGLANGSVNITVSGATSPYQYLWSNNSNSEDLTSVVLGNYSLTITDDNTCDTSFSFTITEPDTLNPSFIQQNVTCNGGSDGSIDLSVIGGSSGYTYNWSTSSNSQDISGLNAGIYTVTISDIAGCDTILSITITEPVPVLTTISGISTICQEEIVTLTASGANTYSWGSNPSLNTTIGDQVLASPTSSQTYAVVGTDTNGCFDSAWFTLTVLPKPNVTSNPSNSTICLGESINISALGASQYSWSPSNGLSSTSGSLISASPAVTTNYMLIGSFANGCSDTSYIPITVNNPPVVAVTAASSSICINDSIQLSASGAVTYSWYYPVNISATSGSNIFAFPTSNTTYHVIGTDAFGCMDTAHIPLVVNPLPVMDMIAPTAAICYGDTAVLSASGAVNYSWSPTANSGSPISVYPLATTQYTVLGTDANGCQDTAMGTVFVNPLPIVNINPAADTICRQDSISLVASGGISYQWSPSLSLSSSSGASVNAGPISTTVYTVTATDINGCQNTATSEITVLAQPIVGVTAASSSICINDSTQLSASGAVTYSWYYPVNISATSGSNIFAFPTTNTTYHVIGTDAFGCTDTAHIPLVVNPLPVMNIIAPIGICNGDTCQISVNGASSYNWSPTTGINPTTGNVINCFPTVTTNYTVLGTDSNGCMNTASKLMNVYSLPNFTISPTSDSICKNDSTIISLIGPNGLNYTWDPCGSLSSPTGENNYASPIVNTTYTITATDIHACSSTENVIIYVNDLPGIFITPNNPDICLGDSISLQINSSQTITSYSWNTGQLTDVITVSPAIPTTYIGIGFDANGCSNSDTVLLNVNETPSFTLVSDSAICQNNSANIHFITSTSLPYSINFDFDNGLLISGTGTGPYLVEWSSSGTKVVKLSISKGNCPSIEDSNIIIVYETPIADFTIDAIATCKNTPVQFNNLSSDSNLTYLWDFGDINSNNNSSNLFEPLHIYENEGLYTLKLWVANSYGCSDSLFKFSELMIHPSPVADFSFLPHEVSILNPIINFYDNSILGHSWKWEFGDINSGLNNFSDFRDPYHIYSDSGKYKVNLIVETEFGCLDSTSKYIDIGFFPSIYIPTAFTPNNDNLNDVFKPIASGYSWNDYEFYIYNRWGQMIFMTRNIDEGWDGNHKGEPCPSDVYTCIVLLKDFNGKPKRFVESVTLLK